MKITMIMMMNSARLLLRILMPSVKAKKDRSGIKMDQTASSKRQRMKRCHPMVTNPRVLMMRLVGILMLLRL